MFGGPLQTGIERAVAVGLVSRKFDPCGSRDKVKNLVILQSSQIVTFMFGFVYNGENQ